MAKQIDLYTYRVTWSEEDQEYAGSCAEFPSLSWLESSQEKALAGMRKLPKSNVADLQKNEESVPNRYQPIPTPANSWCGFRPKFIAHSHLRRPTRV